MFTGIIEATGQIHSLQPRGGDIRLQIVSSTLDFADVALGDSIAVSGVCLTAVEFFDQGFGADVSRETLSRTSLGELTPGAWVNLEKALLPTTRLGGHLVSGHVDGLGRVIDRRRDGRSERWRFEAPADLARYIAPKGSICINGVSLTVNEVDGAIFGINLVPHTLENTQLHRLKDGDKLNIEVDLLARYVERLLDARTEAGSGLSNEFLAEHGFLANTK